MNAARHGGGSSARVELEVRGDQVSIVVSDNGHGFKFRGSHDLAAMTRMNVGPVTLKERISPLEGRSPLNQVLPARVWRSALPIVRTSA